MFKDLADAIESHGERQTVTNLEGTDTYNVYMLGELILFYSSDQESAERDSISFEVFGYDLYLNSDDEIVFGETNEDGEVTDAYVINDPEFKKEVENFLKWRLFSIKRFNM